MIGELNYTGIGNIPTGHTYLFTTVLTWGSASGGFSVVGATGNSFFVIGEAGVGVNGLKIRLWYMV